MNKRQHKKLCKKAAEIIGFDRCFLEDGVWWCGLGICGEDSTECDHEGVWYLLKAMFEYEINTLDCKPFRFKPKSEQIKPTPANVLAWARNQPDGYWRN